MSSDDETSSEDDGYEESIEANDDSDIEIDQESLPHYLTVAAKRHEQLEMMTNRLVRMTRSEIRYF